MDYQVEEQQSPSFQVEEQSEQSPSFEIEGQPPRPHMHYEVEIEQSPSFEILEQPPRPHRSYEVDEPPRPPSLENYVSKRQSVRIRLLVHLIRRLGFLGCCCLKDWLHDESNSLADESNSLAKPQSYAYFLFMCAMMGIVTFLLGAIPSLLRQSKSLFEVHSGVFIIMTIVSGSMAVLASGILILASLYLKSWMRNIHYTILKTIGSFSAILVAFSLGTYVFLPSGDLNWRAYTVLGVIAVGLLFLYSLIWKVACAHHKEDHYNKYPIHWAFLLIILVPFAISLVRFFYSNLRWEDKETHHSMLQNKTIDRP